MRKLAIAAAALLVLSACNDERPDKIARFDATRGGLMAPAEAAAPAPQQTFSFSHYLSITMNASSVAPRFQRTRDLCLNDASQGCELLSSNLEAGDEAAGTSPNGQLVLMLPHDKVKAFEDQTIAPLPGESADSVRVPARSTAAENVTSQVVDIDRRLAQLTDYRDRLTALSKRADVRVAELIQLADALSKVQAEIEQVAGEQRDANNRAAKERLTINLSEREGSATFRPIALVMSSALAILAESAAAALRFLILSLPWLPIVAAAIWAIGWLWRRIRGTRAARP